MGLFDDTRRRKGSKSNGSLMEELTEFYRSHKFIVYAYFFKITGSRDVSDELTQETFFQAVKSIHRFKENSTLKTWLLQIARNVYRNKVRTWVKDKDFIASNEVELQSDDSLNPLNVSLSNQTKHEIQQIFAQLPEDYRDVLVFKEIQGLSHVEIAQILQKTPQSTKVMLFRAKKRFKELYQNEVVHDEKSM